MIVLRVQPDALTAQSLAYAAVVRRVADATEELLLTVQLCAGALPDVTDELAPGAVVVMGPESYVASL